MLIDVFIHHFTPEVAYGYVYPIHVKFNWHADPDALIKFRGDLMELQATYTPFDANTHLVYFK
jgi:hypothetical protein